MDAVDTAQQFQLDSLEARADGNDRTDTIQSDALSKLQNNTRFMFILLCLNSMAALAQIAECYKIWTGHSK